VTIHELAAGGDGVALADIGGERRAVFVPGVVPGERVEVAADLSTRPARGRLLAVLSPSASRVSVACVHADACGACDWMHLSPEARLREHGAMIARVLPRRFARETVSVTAATQPLAYRSRARVHVEASGRDVKVGMFGRRSREAVHVDSCIVLAPEVEAARRALEALLAGARGRGEAQLALSAPGERRRAVFDLRWRGTLPPAVFARAESAVASGPLAGLRIFEESDEGRAPGAPRPRPTAVIGDPTPWIVGADGAPLRLAPGGFSQATEEGNAKLAAHVAELAASLSPAGAATLELYAGAGNLTVLLARDRKVVAVESDGDACVAARANLTARGLDARIVEADASTHPIPPATKLVVLDPPRTGAREVARALAARPVPAVVYVSCDPPTLGRDLGVLADAGYELRAAQGFEMFPQTSHVETVCALVRGKR